MVNECLGFNYNKHMLKIMYGFHNWGIITVTDAINVKEACFRVIEGPKWAVKLLDYIATHFFRGDDFKYSVIFTRDNRIKAVLNYHGEVLFERRGTNDHDRYYLPDNNADSK